MNNFPQGVIVREKKMARKKNQENERMEGRPDGDTSKGKESKRTVTNPYIKGMSEAIRRVLAPLGIRTAMRAERIKWSVLRGIKDWEEKTEVPGVVYAVGCEECKEVYIGETKRKAQQRIKEHKADTRIGRVDKSAIAEHTHVTGHRIIGSRWWLKENSTAEEGKWRRLCISIAWREEEARWTKWLATKQNVARLSSIDQREEEEEEEQEQEQRRKTCVDSDEVNSFFQFLFFYFNFVLLL